MGITLTGKRVQNTYDALLKITDNDNLTGVPKKITSGLGTDSPIYLSTDKLGIGISPSVQFQTSGDAEIGNDLTVGGDLTVNGTTTFIDSTIVEIGDNMIELAKDNTANIKDIGWYGTINDGTEKYVGVFYDASTGTTTPEFHIGLGTSEPGSTATWSTKGKLIIGNIDSTGGAFSGHITIPETPTADNHAASKKYVDDNTAAETAERIEIQIKNVSGGQLNKGDVLHASPSASPPSGNVVEVIKADYDDADKMPAIAILNEDVANDNEGAAVMMGAVSGFDTSSFSAGDELYVGNDGAFRNTKPTAVTGLIQKIAVVVKSHATNGLIKVFGAGRSNDVPNLVDRNITFGEIVSVDEYIRHYGDTDTYIRFLDDRIDIRAGNISFIDLREDTNNFAYFNVSNNDIDFQFRGTTNNNLIRTDAGNDRVGIGRQPSYALDIGLGTNNSMRVISDDDIAQIIMSDDDTTAYFGVKNSMAYMSFTSGTPSAGFYIDSSGNGTFAGGVTLTDGSLDITQSVGTETFKVTTPYDRVGKFVSTDAGAFLAIQDNTSTDNGVGINVTGDVLKLLTANTVGFTLDASQNATFAGDLTVSGGDIILGGTGRIQGIDTITDGTDAVNKNYVDDNTVDGSGTANYIPKWSDADTLGDSVIFQDGTDIGIGISSADYKLDVGGAIGLSGRLHIDTDGDEYKIGADDYTTDQTGGVMVRPADNVNPTEGDALFVVRSGGGSPRLFVEHSGTTGTTNSRFTVGATSTRGDGSVVLSSSGDSFITNQLALGKSTASYQLDVDGSIKASNQGRFANGSASAPAYSFDTDSDTGMYRTTTNSLGFATAGTNALTIGASQNATFSGTIKQTGKTFTIETNDPEIVLKDTDEGTDDKVFRIINVSEELRFTARNDDNSANADGGDVLKITRAGNSTFAGTLASSTQTITSSDDQILTLDQTGGGWNYIGFESDGTRNFYVGQDSSENFVIGSDNSLDFYFTGFDEIKYGASDLINTGNILPNVDSTYNLGSTSLRWANVWADNINGGSPVNGSGQADRIAFWTDSDTISYNSNLRYDEANQRVGIGTTAPDAKLTITSSNGDENRTLKINHTRNAPDTATNAIHIDANFSGTKSVVSDTVQSGIYIDLDSSADGSSADEVRSYGVYVDARITGFNDILRGGYFYVESNNTTEKTSEIVGVYANATHDSSSTNGGVSNMYGVRGVCGIQDYGDVDNSYAVHGLVQIANNRNANVDATRALYGEIQIDEATELSYGTMIGCQVVIDNNEGSVPTFGTQYLFKGDYQGTQATGSYGIYVEGSRHYLANKVGVGNVDPQAYLHVGANSAVGAEAFIARGDTDNSYVVSIEQDHATGWGMIIDTDATDADSPALKITNPSGTLMEVASNGDVEINGDVTINGIDNATAPDADRVLVTSDTSGEIQYRTTAQLADDMNVPTGIGGAGLIPIYETSNTFTTGSLYWDIANGRMGINQISPAERLHVGGSIRLETELQIFAGTTDIGQISNSGGALNIQGTSTRDVSLGSDSFPQAVFIEGSNGRVVIGGTTASANTLTLSGTATEMDMTNTSTNGRQYRLESDSSGNFVIKDRTANVDRIVLDSSGSVGIGTSSPGAKLHVHSTSGDGKIRVTGDNIINSGGTIKGFNNGLAFNVAPSGGGTEIEAIRINGNGYLGIGTSSPASLLEIYGGGNTFRMDSAGNTSKTFLMRNVNTATAEIKTDGNLDINIEDANRTMRFLNGNTERLRLASDGLATFAGKVRVQGDPPITPNTNFDDFIITDSAHAGMSIFSGSNTHHGAIYFGDPDANNSGQIKYLHDTDVLTLGAGGGTVGITIASDGDVQIPRYLEHAGDTNSYLGWSGGDDFRIYVGGRELVRLDEGTDPDIAKFMTDEFRMYSSGDFHADGDVIAYSTTTSSDKRLKKDIKPIDNALDIVEKLQGVHFNWKENDEKSIGYIAQDVEKILPEMVKEKNHFDKGEFKTVNYAAMVSIMGEAIKELRSEVEQLKKQINGSS